jgi:ribose transport system substrate-binding protein
LDVIPQTTAQELWESEHAGAHQAANRLGWSLYWNGPSRDDDVPRQIQLVHRVIERGAAGLILSPDHSVALIGPVREVLAAGIPVVLLGSPLALPADKNLSFVLNDESETGRLVTERLLPRLKPGDSVAVLGVNPAILALVDRAHAIESSLHTADPSLHLIERRSTSFGFDEAEETAEEVLRSNPGLRAIVTLDIHQTRAVYYALTRLGLEGRVLLIGCDQDLDLVRLLREGNIDAIVAENTFAMGTQAVQIIARLRKGQTAPERVVISPLLVTRDNVDRPDVQQVLDMNWSAH